MEGSEILKLETGAPMETRDRASVLDWLKKHALKKVVIRMQGTTLKVAGTLEGLAKLDACSTEIDESSLSIGLKGIQVSMSLHQNSLSMHLMAFGEKTENSLISMPVSIPYNLLILRTPEEDEKLGKSPKDREEEVTYSPYELLH